MCWWLLNTRFKKNVSIIFLNPKCKDEVLVFPPSTGKYFFTKCLPTVRANVINSCWAQVNCLHRTRSDCRTSAAFSWLTDISHEMLMCALLSVWCRGCPSNFLEWVVRGLADGSEMKTRRQSNYGACIGADLLCGRDFMTVWRFFRVRKSSTQFNNWMFVKFSKEISPLLIYKKICTI